MSKIFLLGHKGFVGSHLLPKLQEANYEVVTDLRYWNDRYDVIINLAAVTHLRTEFDPKLIESNIILPYHLFNRPERIIYASSCSARHNSNPYSSSKIWSEFLGEKHGNALGLRFFNIFGSGNNKGIVKYLMDQPDGSKIAIRGPETIRDYIYIDDVVSSIMKQLGKGWVVDLGVVRKYAKDNTTSEKDLKYFIENHEEVPGASSKIEIFKPGIIDVGTGIGTKTIDLVSLYCNLSGKRFEVDIIPPDPSEPLEMVSENIVPHMDLKTGLLKLINNEIVQAETINSRN